MTALEEIDNLSKEIEMKSIQLEEATKKEKELNKKTSKKEAKIKDLQDQLTQEKIFNLIFTKSTSNLNNTLDQQIIPIDWRGIGFETNQKYYEAKNSKEKEIEYLRKHVLKERIELNLVKKHL